MSLATRAKARFLLGNHDEVFLKAATGDVKAMRFFTKIGGKETILSYGVTPEEYHSTDYEELTLSLVRQVPEDHKAFLESFENYVEIGDYLFVHAGIRPGVDLARQTLTDLRWIRREFLDHRDHHGKMVVHGHSISDSPDLRRNRIGIDTGAFASGRLTALGLEGSDYWFVSAVGEPDPRWNRMTD
jgi:serine/threonine protein phosphatase 1